MDSIANALNKIKMANLSGRENVEVPASKLLKAIVDLLKREGYIRNYRVLKAVGPGGVIRVYLRYEDKKSILTTLKKVSRPGLRVYRKKKDIPLIRAGLGTVILTTSRGIMTDRQAREVGVGGEVLCYMW